MVIVDTDFLSSFFKINRLKLILRVLKIKYLIVPSTVYEELMDSYFFIKIVYLFAFKKEDLNKESYILVKKVNLNDLTKYFELEKIKMLGEGEKGCFLLAKKIKDKILIDDQQARKIAKEENLKVISITAFLLHCKKRNILSIEEIKQITKDLKEKDYYEFTKEIKETLLKK